MALLSVAPTKSNLLALRRQLEFAQEGYDLLEQKRQVLVLELLRRLERARAAEREAHEALRAAFAALREAALDSGAPALDRAALAVRPDHAVELSQERLLGLRLPRVAVRLPPPGPRFGFGATSANADAARQGFVAALPLLGALAERETSVRRLAHELRRTQRRCNALAKVVIPNCRETIRYIGASLEERERESFVILKMIRDRLAGAAEA
jgi:V/A-type H+-transporting ATPase subunit D